MSGLFGALDIASRSLLITQGGIRTTGHNIANVSTPGYSRQTQVLAAARPELRSSGALGTGVEQLSIQRFVDPFVARQILAETASGQSLLTQSNALNAIEQILNEQQEDGISAALARLYDAFDDLAGADNGGAPQRTNLIGAAQQLVDSLHRADSQLREQQRAADRALVVTVGQINALTERIGDLNRQIVSAESIAPANDLRDQRDLALRELAGLVDIQTFEQDNGSAVVMLTEGGTLVQDTNVTKLVATGDPSNPFDPTFSRIFLDGAAPRDVTANIAGGELGGLLRVRDVVIPAAIRGLDVLAYNVMDSINTQHALGQGLNGTGGGNPFFEPLGAVEDAARDLQVAAGIVANPDTIAAGFTGTAGDIDNARALADLRDAAFALSLPGDPPGPASGPTRSLLEQAAVIISDVGFEAASVRDASVQHARVLEVLENRRDAVSGVSIDEEVTNLVQLQAIFQANSRVISTVNQLLEELVSIL